MDDSWQLEAVPVRISLGEKTLFRPRLPLLVYQGFFNTLPAAPAPLELPMDRMRREAGGFYVPSRPVAAPLPPFAVEDGMLRFASCFTRRLLTFGKSFEEYARKWSSRSRGNLRRRQRDFAKLSGATPPVVKQFRTVADVDAYLAAIDDVARRSYQASLLGTVVDDGFAAQTRELARAGRLLGFVLYHGDRPVAFTHLSARDRTLLLVRLAYDAEYRSHAPGMVLLLGVLEILHGEGRWDVLDFGGGDAEYKTFLSTEGVLCAELFYLRPTPRNLAVMGLRESLSGMTRTAVKVLDRVGAKDRVKRYLRQRAAGSSPPPAAED